MLSTAANAYATLMAGFTTIQSPGSPEDKDLRDWIAARPDPRPARDHVAQRTQPTRD